MSEEQQYQGDRWTSQSQNILKNLGWNQNGDSNFDIPCTNKSAHRTGESSVRKNPHGIDLLFSYFDPFLSKDISIIVESKHRKWAGISKSTVQEFLDQVLMTIECASSNPELKMLGCENIRTGLLMIWCNEPEKFDNEKFKEYVKELDIKTRRNPITIFVASNNEILKWCSIIEKVKELKPTLADFKFFYPSDFFSNGLSTANRKDHLTLIQMFSPYVFAKSKKIIRLNRETQTTQDINHIFFFAKPTIDELNFMFSCTKKFQFEDADKLIIHFYGQQTHLRVHIEEFIRRKNEKYEKDGSHLTIEIDYLNILSDVPENYSKGRS
ncbi:hypothetical protein [Peribacillus asahii]|uniref:hypothetical protein n=1 Tax=Peribacillus asahii TaxID=228899 RepID=UPI00207ADCAB|nr:hypothetical protein [Peribacillus asahii]USK71782.1 hypothetical protein LIS76_08515 [Peribacillus asahii]